MNTLSTCARTLLFSAIFVAAAATSFAQTSSSSWRFEEAAGTTLLDSSGGNSGTLVNGVTRLSSGRAGKALRFDGVDDYATFGDPASLEAPAFSVALWVRRQGVQQSWAKILNKGTASSAPWASYKIEFDGTSDAIVNWHLGFTDGSSAVARSVTALPDSAWAHLVGTYDGSSLKLYINGTLNQTTAISGKTVRFDSVPFTLGGYAGWGNFHGDLDEVRYFNRALSASEVLAVYNGVTATPQLTVSQPNTYVTWAIGTVRSIRWTHNLASTSTSNITISRDGGATWSLLAGNVVNGSLSGTYSWTVSGPATTQARIRVTATGGSPLDASDVSFTIAAPALTITSPNLSSTIWNVGQASTVSWTGNLSPQEYVKLDLSLDGGVTYPIVLASSTPSDGVESVIPPVAWLTTNGRVRVSWVKSPSVFDVSNASFKVLASLTSITFPSTTAIFPNPERGFTSWTDLSLSNFSRVTKHGHTISHIYFRLDSYRSSPLPQSFLTLLPSAFQKARQEGIKLIPRFTYNFPANVNNDPDASEQQIQQHIQQVAPILAANDDVILALEAGFIGLWGEWHTSSHGLDTNTGAKAAILNSLLSALPSSRMVALRYPTDMQLLNGPAITSAEAFTGTNRARIGSHQDCFLASDDDWGTWGRTGNSIAYDKAYVASNGQYAVVGGETCNPNPPRSDCPTALSELKYLHWTYLNSEYEPRVLQGFINGGCYDDIDRQLGYRFRLVSGSFSAVVKRGQAFQYTLRLVNDGFAAMFNERPVYVVIYKGLEQYTCPVNTDPRRWAPSATISISGGCTLPVSMTTGTYSWALWMPDEAQSLQDDPRYAVRLANQITWNATLGYNVLVTNITITP
jgi:hypothetical protein